MNETLRAIVAMLPVDDAFRDRLYEGAGKFSPTEQAALVAEFDAEMADLRVVLKRLGDARRAARRRIRSVEPDHRQSGPAEAASYGTGRSILLKDLLECGVHFGHQTKRWNPKMKSYIFGERNGIYIIDLAKTARLARAAESFVTSLAAQGRTVLFVGTKRQAQDAIAEEATRCGMFYINQRWLGGLLTNFGTVQRSLQTLRDLEAMEKDGRYDLLSKKEIARVERQKRKLLKNLEGIRHMTQLPDALFVVDTRKEKIAVDEARKLKIPVVGILDTNADPDDVDYPIPGNDDALKAIRLFTSRIADAVLDGRRESERAADTPEEMPEPERERRRPEVAVGRSAAVAR